MKSVVIVGAGEFGLATALELTRKGGYRITILDRCPPPVPDGSSVDLNRIVRPDYSDEVYCKMALEAIDKWNTDPVFAGCYSESGIVFSVAENEVPHYADKSLINVEKVGIKCHEVTNRSEISSLFPGWDSEVSFTRGYGHKKAGWAFAERAVKQVANYLSYNGVTFISGASGTVTEIMQDPSKLEGHAAGVLTQDGTRHFADLVVIAAGAWSHGLFPNIATGGKRLIAVGQPVAFIKLTPDEVKRLKDYPVYLSHENGFFSFPPSADGYLKVARHCFGFTIHREANTGEEESLPPKLPVYSCELPSNMEKFLRDNMRKVYGTEIADREFARSKLCFYSDTADGDFIFDYHPQLKNVFVCCGGSGHGFKFFSVLGKYSVGCLDKSLDEQLLKKWSWKKNDLDTTFSVIDGSRHGDPRAEIAPLKARI